jgi:hypothetical protein
MAEMEKEKETFIDLQLGDVLRITDPSSEELNNNIFLINYIDNQKINLLNIDTFSTYELIINPDKTIGNNTITSISILSRSNEKGYAKQNGLLPGIWVNIYFGGSIPLVITGEITNLEEDMIEVKTFPDNAILYLNFDYKGIPEDVPIENIEIRSKPEQAIEIENRKMVEEAPPSEINKEINNIQLEEEGNENIGEIDNEMMERDINSFQPIVIKDHIREFIVKADQIQFGNEQFGAITQLIDVGVKKQRYSIEDQANDLLDDLLSTIPNSQRTTKVLNNIHIMIERFKQLRSKYSYFNENGNIEGFKKNEMNWKPLKEYFKNFNQILYWVLPVVKNIKKVYDILNTEEDINDIQVLQTLETITSMNNKIELYKSNDLPNEENKYTYLYSQLDPYFTPFDYISPETNYDIIYEKEVGSNITTIIDNLTDFYSSVAQNNNIKSTRFVIGKYNLGLTKLDTSNLSANKTVTHRVLLTNPDLLEVKSFITLPEPTIRFSKINLPTTSILDRANLNTIFLNYWQIFNKKTRVNSILIDNITKELVFDEKEFLNGIKNYILNLPEDSKQGFSTTDIYLQFINTIVPTTVILFNLVKKYIHGKLSLVEVVSYLEPFLVYTDDLTYRQYQNIIMFISEKINFYNKAFPENHRLFMKLTRVSSAKELSFQAFSIVNILSTENNLRENILNKYDFHDVKKRFTNSEILRKLIIKDYGNLYFNALSIENIPLMFSADLDEVFNQEKNNQNNLLKKEEKNNPCKNYIVAKQYSSMEELEKDNNIDIYFDKKFDNTKYSFLEEYQRELLNMPSEQFFEFLIKKMQTKMKLSYEEAEYLADTLINGVKKVLDGQYAIIYTINNSNETQIKYFKRNNNVWVLDETVQKDLFTANQNILCNFQEKCLSISNPKDINESQKCISLPMNSVSLKEQTLNSILDEFDEKYIITKENYEKNIRSEFNYRENIIEKISEIEFYNILKYNNEQYKIGNLSEEDNSVIVSPYFKLRDIILGQQDFTKKQMDIIRFVMEFTREPYLNIIGPLGEEENKYWLYCIKTNVKLFPSFLYQLACGFVNDYENYNNIVNLLIKSIGALSDDGDAWVDKNSGYVIKKIDFDVEEGYDDGFKIKSRDQLEQDLGDTLLTETPIKINYTSPQSKMVSNIITTLSIAMGINIENQREFIINNVNNILLEQLPTETQYKKKIQEMANKGKNIPSYKELYNTFVLYFTLGMVLIGIQTSIPSIKTRKTFPGCIKSFEGYPLEGAGDLSSLNYIACVAYKIRSSIEPWSSLQRKKENDIASKLKEFVDKFLLSIPEVTQKMKEKVEFMLSNPVEIISSDHDISNWSQFLPPLAPIKLKVINNISNEFKTRLNQDLRIGSKSQDEKILVIQSKIIFFSLGLQENIQNIIKKEKLLLSSSSNEPYLENACCSENGEFSTIQYFEKKSSDIKLYNENVFQLSSILIDIKQITEAIVFSTKNNTKNIYPSLPINFNEETIYLAFIHYCHFKSLLPLNENLIPICSDKPDYLSEKDSIAEIIRKLKSDGRNYTNSSFLRLLQIVSRENIVHIELNPITISTIQKLRNIVELFEKDMDKDKNSFIDKVFTNLLSNVMDTFDIASNVITSETKALNNYLIKNIEILKIQSLDFIKKNGNLSKKEIKQVDVFLNTLMEWTSAKKNINEEWKISEDELYNGIHFFKSYIINFIDIFPNIILNKVDYNKTNIPKYWGLSERHSNDVNNIIKDYYKDLKSFYSNNIISNILNEIQIYSKQILLLIENTPSFSSIKNKNDIIKPIFDERTSKLLFEFYFYKVIEIYIYLSNMESMIVREKRKDVEVNELYSVDYIEEKETMTNIDITTNTKFDTLLVKGDQKNLRNNIAKLLVCFINIMKNHKSYIDISYDDIMDRIFKLKEKEKNMVTERLKDITDEERDVDTILKINKLGIWSKGLQKGLTTYVKDNYDEERDFMDKMEQYETILKKKNKNITDNNIQQYLDDYIDEIDTEMEVENDAYDMSTMLEDYNDGNYEGDELEENDYLDNY